MLSDTCDKSRVHVVIKLMTQRGVTKKVLRVLCKIN